MKQYKRIKEQHKDCILLFGMGVFYETFFEDAKVLAEKFGNKIVYKDYGYDALVPMCGIPARAMSNYAKRLVDNGHRVAVCNQVKGKFDEGRLVHREVIEVIDEKTKNNLSKLESMNIQEGNASKARIKKEKSKIEKRKIEETKTEEAKVEKLETKESKTEEAKIKRQKKTMTGDELLKELQKIDLDEMTPSAALILLYKWEKACEGARDGL